METINYMFKEQNIAYANKSATPPHTVIHHDKIICPLMDVLLSFKKSNNVPWQHDYVIKKNCNVIQSSY